jgi:hypothetical protein
LNEADRSDSKKLLREKMQTSPMKLNTNLDEKDEFDEFNCITPKKVENEDEEE